MKGATVSEVVWREAKKIIDQEDTETLDCIGELRRLQSLVQEQVK